MRFPRISTGLLSAMALMAASLFAAPISAQSSSTDPGVAVHNDSMHELRVYAFSQEQADRVLLGWIGSDELEFYKVPEEARTPAGGYMIAVQQVSPLPQIGVSAEPHPVLATPILAPSPDETVRVNVDDDLNLSSIIIH